MYYTMVCDQVRLPKMLQKLKKQQKEQVVIEHRQEVEANHTQLLLESQEQLETKNIKAKDFI